MLVTPFNADGKLCFRDVDALVDYVLKSDAPGFSLLGLAGEASSLDIDERKALTERVISRAGDRKPVIVGTAAPTMTDAADLAAHASAAGAAALMVAPPSAGADGARDVDGYFEAVLKAAGDTAVMIQDAPSYVGTSLRPTLARELAERYENVRYVKAEGFPIVDHLRAIVDHTRGLGITVFGGNGGVHFLDAMDAGASGMIPGCEYIEEHMAIFAAFNQGRPAEAKSRYRRMMPLLAYQMQSLPFFIACNKEVLCVKGIVTTPHVRDMYRMTPRARRLLFEYVDEAVGTLERFR